MGQNASSLIHFRLTRTETPWHRDAETDVAAEGISNVLEHFLSVSSLSSSLSLFSSVLYLFNFVLYLSSSFWHFAVN